MAETPNFWTLYDRLLQEASVSPLVAGLVEAALQDEDALTAAVSGTNTSVDTSHRPPPGTSDRPAGAFLEKLEVERFRGIGPKVSVRFTKGPGLTLVVGRNGSGKSSLADGLEMVLTGKSLRWASRKPAKEWTSGWRNLHEPGAVNLRASFSVEDRSQPVTLARNWSADAGLTDDRFTVREGTEELSGIEALAWTDALGSCRPFLSYNELSSALDSGPSKLFDALEALLGLEDVAAARERVRQARLTLERSVKKVKADRRGLATELAGTDDPRAARALTLLDGRSADLDGLEELVLTADEETADSEVRVLRQLAALRTPTTVEVLEATDLVRTALTRQAELAATGTGRALATAELLDKAVRWSASQQDSSCPVCESPAVLDEAWRERAASRVEQMRASAAEAGEGTRALATAVEALRKLARNLPSPLESTLSAGAAAVEARRQWGELPAAPLAMADHLEQHLASLESAYAAVAQEATEHLEALQATWRPVQRRLVTWLDAARAVDRSHSVLKGLKEAEAWLKSAEADLRNEAFTPIAEQAQATWNQLRQQSNVSLARPRLKGSSTRRQVELNITVDGTEGVALGVMSQGELNALALSLFLPRLTRPDSPFRFVVIDDPVQAMDPAKVDGLARVLESAARTHQVIVFTHDARLPAAVRRLGISAHVLEVARHTDSRVEVKPAFDPVTQHLSDARHLESQRDKLGDELVRTVVPGLCRAAVEAALVERTWAQLLGQGRRHRDIEAGLARARGIHDLAALAFYGDPDRGADVLGRLNQFGRWAGDHFQALKAHGHAPLPVQSDVSGFIDDTYRLAHEVAP